MKHGLGPAGVVRVVVLDILANRVLLNASLRMIWCHQAIVVKQSQFLGV
jgi:hypothetical protein